MKNRLPILLILFSLSCNFSNQKIPKTKVNHGPYYNLIDTENYELILPTSPPKAVLILFPGFPENPARIKQEFKIVQPAIEKDITLVLMKFNQRLWLKTEEKLRLTKILNEAFQQNNLPNEKVFIGGFSSGGNVSLLLANHLKEMDNIIQPHGVFIIDSPVDLLALYEVAQRNLQRNFSQISINESNRTIARFEADFGKPEDSLDNYERYAPYTFKTNNSTNLTHLNGLKIRLYTEPDIEWWQQNRQNEYEDMNAFYIKKLAENLTQKYGDKVEYIPTENRGYRANGQRHPHAWSIVDISNLLEWMLNT